MQKKSWYQSKTFWTNIIAILLALVGPSIGIPTDEYPEATASALAVINLVLRIVTKSPIGLS